MVDSSQNDALDRAAAIRLIQALARRRQELGLSQTEVAARMGTSQSALARLEAGEGDPRLSTVQKYAAAVQGELIPRIRTEGSRLGASFSKGLVSASDLEHWAPRTTAQTQLSLLLRRLIRATTLGISRLHFPSDEGTQLSGWDGLAEVEVGNEYVPDGLSVWEIGTSSNVKRKADSDFRKRTSDPLGVAPEDATFVFVTPRRWRSREPKTSWESARRSESSWKNVRLLDAEDLAAWLELAPPIHYWLSEELGRAPRNARPLESWWETWSGVTTPEIIPSLLTSGREKQSKELAEFLRGPKGALSLLADSPDEAVAFVAATLLELRDAEGEQLLTPCLVVEEEAAWRHAVASDVPLILIPTFSGAAITSEASLRHHVIIPLARGMATGAASLVLPRLNREIAKTALKKMAKNQPQESKHRLNLDSKVDDLSGVARRSLLSLRRRMSLIPEMQRPEWASPENAVDLIAPLLVGSWDEEKEGDLEVLGDLTGTSYASLVIKLEKWLGLPDPPFRRIGRIWYLVDREDSWSLLASSLSRQHVDRFEATFLKVLGEPLPKTELPDEDQWRAGLLGATPRHSSQVREGLAETLALMAARDHEVEICGQRQGQAIANRLVYRLLDKANHDETNRLWASLEHELPLLAESAPEEFLDAIEEMLSNEHQARLWFRDSKNRDSMFVGSPPTGLLWALEGLGWTSEYLPRVAMILCRLDQLDPGGRFANRPRASFREIYLPWHPQTSATPDERIASLEGVLEREPEAAWKPIVALLPETHEVAMNTHAPRWRDWRPVDDSPRTYGEIARTIRLIVEMLLRKAGNDPDRWSSLIKKSDNLPSDLRDSILDGLASLDVTELEDQARLRISETLRKVATRHRRYPTAQWALPSESLDRYESLYGEIQPSLPTLSHKWLFNTHVELPRDEELDLDWREEQLAVDKKRQEAIEEILELGGLNLLLEFSQEIDRPDDLGRALGSTVRLNPTDELAVLNTLSSDDDQLRSFAQGYVFGRFRSESAAWAWAETVLEAAVGAWPADRLVSFLLSLPRLQKTWEWVEKAGRATAESYWTRANHWLEDRADYKHAVRNFIEYRRPRAAIDVLAFRLHDGEEGLDSELVKTALEAAATTPSDEPMDSSFSYHVEQLLQYLDRTDTEEAVLARLEFLYLPLLRHSERSPKILHEQLARDPNFFCQVLGWVYKAEGEEQNEVSDEQRRLAERGYELLDSWRRVPGMRDDGRLDLPELQRWITQARTCCKESGRSAIGDQRIGHILRYSPEDADGLWPAEAIREVIESIASRELERGLEIEIYNSRGVTTRSLTEGGRKERDLVSMYSNWARATSGKWPRTAALLKRVARAYEADAEREDLEAELREDRW
jgi:transcriptional regulator with XRE-family HTH domain